MPEPISQTRVQKLIKDMADALDMPDPSAARQHARIASVDYGYAYRNARVLSPETTKSLIESAWVHMERAIKLGWDRELIEENFHTIRSRYAGTHVSC